MSHCCDIKHRKRTYLAWHCPMTDGNKAMWKRLIFQHIFRHLLFIFVAFFFFCIHNFPLLRFFLVRFLGHLCSLFIGSFLQEILFISLQAGECVWCTAIFSEFFFFCDIKQGTLTNSPQVRLFSHGGANLGGMCSQNLCLKPNLIPRGCDPFGWYQEIKTSGRNQKVSQYQQQQLLCLHMFRNRQ